LEVFAGAESSKYFILEVFAGAEGFFRIIWGDYLGDCFEYFFIL
jgi:hypothetical protein